MKAWVSIHVGQHDRPVVALTPADGESGEGITVRLSDEVTILGDRDDVERWVRDMAAQVAMQEAS